MFGSSEMVIVLVIVLVLFGGSQLPKLAKNLGKAQKEFKEGMGDLDGSKKPADANLSATPPAPTPPVVGTQADPPPPPLV
jgi:sec-independent protein translocase protein TatA